MVWKTLLLLDYSMLSVKVKMPKFNFNYCKSIFYLFILCLWIKLLLFNYNIHNNLTIIIIYSGGGKGLTLKLGSLVVGHEQIIIIEKAGGTYKWMKVGNQAGWARFVCAAVSGNG